MISFFLTLFTAASLGSVSARPTLSQSPARRDLSQVISNCNHDFAYTWDDGPYIYHQDVLDAFNGVNGKTTFFMNGDNYQCIYSDDNVQRLRATYEGGHMVASHTWSHADLTTLTEAQIDVEIQRLDEAFVKILGIRPKFLRPPYGSIDDRTASYIQQKYGKTIVLWSEDSTDSVGGTAQDSYNFYQGWANESPKRPHMTLSHETQQAGIDALHMGTVPLLANAGINLLTVAQCLDTDPYEQVGSYGTRDDTWYCGGTWTPPTSGGGTGTGTGGTGGGTGTGTGTGGGGTNTTCVTNYTSVSGDTCTSIGSSFGLTADAILAANTFLNCTDIWTNTPVCIPSPGTPCGQRINSVAGDTCASLGATYGVSADTIQLWNYWINCNDIWAGTSLCVRH